MAVPLQVVRRFLRLSKNPTSALSRSAFTAKKDDPNNPNWVKVGLSFASTIAIWVLLFKQYDDDLTEYKRRKAERGS